MIMSYFSIEELCKSDTAKKYKIPNIPNETEKRNLQRLIDNVLDPARSLLGKPITISSGFRCVKLNTKVGGSNTSQHVKGEAADLQTYDCMYLFKLIRDNLIFDQLIYETKEVVKGGKIIGITTWVHVSFSEHNRNQAFRMHNGKKI